MSKDLQNQSLNAKEKANEAERIEDVFDEIN